MGEIVDLILLVLGAAALGFSAFAGARELYYFVTTVVNAQSSQDLDVAAQHFAQAVIILGAAVVQAVLMKGAAGKVSARGLPPIKPRIPDTDPLPAGSRPPVARSPDVPSNAPDTIGAGGNAGNVSIRELGVVPRPGMPRRVVKDVNGRPVTIYGQAERSSSTTPGHAEAMKNLVEKLAKSGRYVYITIQRSVRTATGRVSTSRNIPDVIGVRRNGLVDQFEIRSATDKVVDLIKRMKNSSLTLPKANRGSIEVLPPEPPGEPAPSVE